MYLKCEVSADGLQVTGRLRCLLRDGSNRFGHVRVCVCVRRFKTDVCMTRDALRDDVVVAAPWFCLSTASPGSISTLCPPCR